MSDQFIQARLDKLRLAVGVCITTEVCSRPHRSHGLLATSSIALGRLMTAAVLTSQVGEKPKALSLQVLGSGRLGQVFSDVTVDGRVRGYVKNHAMDLPKLPDEEVSGRRSIAAAVGQGSLSAIRFADRNDFIQGTVPLVSGEIDEDVAAFINNSDQVPTGVWCDVLVGDRGDILTAGGLILQAMPDTDAEAFGALREQLNNAPFWKALRASQGDAGALLDAMLPGAEILEEPLGLSWECRCSYERVVTSLKMLDPSDLAEMVDHKETPEVTCEFCGKKYTVTINSVEQAFVETVTAGS